MASSGCSQDFLPRSRTNGQVTSEKSDFLGAPNCQTTLNEYPIIKCRFNEYEQAWMSKPLGSYQPHLVREFFTNYLALLEKDLPKVATVVDWNKLDSDTVQGVDIDILERTLNRFLFGPDYQIPGAIPKLEHQLFTQDEQRPWLERILIDGVDLLWLHTLHAHISRRSLSFRAKFWWAIVRLRLMPTRGDDHLESTRAVIIATLSEGLIVDFAHIIFDELFFWAHKTHTALPFPYLITELCKKANILLISGVDNDVATLHK